MKGLIRPPNSPDFNLIKRLWDVPDKQVISIKAPPHNFRTYSKSSAANVIVPDITAYLSLKFLWSPCLEESQLFWWQQGDLTQYKAVVLIL